MLESCTFKTTEALVQETVELLRETLSVPGTLMLSGGSTPYIAYNQLAQSPCPVHRDRTLFLSDERMVPSDSPHSNTKKLLPMLAALKCQNRFIRIDTQIAAEKAAEQFARDLEGAGKIDLGFLGMGADGHTAGFFTPEQANRKTGSLALYTDRPDGMQGVSVSPALFRRVERIILLVTGESKRAIVDTLMNRPETIPAGIALGDHPHAELWTDTGL